MYLGEMINEYGTQVGVFHCEACDSDYTVCPTPSPSKRDNWDGGCTADTCSTYDPARDCDVLFMNDEEIARVKPIEHLAVLLTKSKNVMRL